MLAHFLDSKVLGDEISFAREIIGFQTCNQSTKNRFKHNRVTFSFELNDQVVCAVFYCELLDGLIVSSDRD